MKQFQRHLLFTILLLCAALLAGCGAQAAGSGPASSALPKSGVSAPEAPSGPEDGIVTAEIIQTFRIVAVQGDSLLLAGHGEGQDGAGALYRLNTAGIPTEAERAAEGDAESGAQYAPAPGRLVDVTYSGATLDTYPLQFSEVYALHYRSDGFDDLCALYLQVLEDLWAVDEGLNSGITQLGVDLSSTQLSPAEQAGVAWAFGEAHGIVPVQGTFAQLAEQGYFTPDDPAAEHPRYHWEDGCLFTITEEPAEGTYSLPTLRFSAKKWRSGTGAYFFTGCTAVQTALGRWDGYTVGASAIS